MPLLRRAVRAVALRRALPRGPRGRGAAATSTSRRASARAGCRCGCCGRPRCVMPDAARAQLEQRDVLLGEPDRRVGGAPAASAPGRPAAQASQVSSCASSIQASGPVGSGVGLDRRRASSGAAARRVRRAKVRCGQPPGSPSRRGQMLLRPLLPAACTRRTRRWPRAARSALRRRGREQVREPVDDVDGPPARCGLIEAEKGDDAVDVDQEERRGRIHRLGAGR